MDRPANSDAIAREKVAYMRSALRSTTVAYLLSPNLCIPLFVDDVAPVLFWTWYGIAMALGLFRIAVSFGPGPKLPAQRTLKLLTIVVAGVGLVWGAGWLLLVPELNQENRYIFLFIVTGTMFSAMFGYGVHRPAFLAVAIPTLAPAPLALFWPNSGFPWPFSVGIVGLMITVYGISRRFERTFVETMRLRFANEHIAEQLAHERDVSIAANLAKSEFIATASHDLRQPMFAINLHLRALEGMPFDRPVQRTLDLIGKSVMKLNAMFSELLDISRADAGVIVPQFGTVGLAQALAEVCANTQVQCEAKGLSFTASLDDLHVRSDPILLAQIVQNLLANAVQNTARGSVTLAANHDGKTVALVVADTGRGISGSHRVRIFDEFYRVPHDSTTPEALPGLGLGLSIVRRLSALLGIDLVLESEPGHGTRFVLHVPAATGRAATKAQMDALSPGELSGRTILVVDDDALVRAAYAVALGSDGARVLETDGADVVAGHMPRVRPDLVIADYKLGGTGTGEHAIESLRAEFGANLPAILITADTSPDHLSAFGRIGVPVLFKPVSYADLRRTIDAQFLRCETSPSIADASATP